MEKYLAEMMVLLQSIDASLKALAGNREPAPVAVEEPAAEIPAEEIRKPKKHSYPDERRMMSVYKDNDWKWNVEEARTVCKQGEIPLVQHLEHGNQNLYLKKTDVPRFVMAVNMYRSFQNGLFM